MILVITGGTGTLGSSIILDHEDSLKKMGISKIRVISRDEQKQIKLMAKYRGHIPLDCFLGDVTDADRMRFALQDAAYVIHAAAQKHVDRFEIDVKTGFKTNIHGTQCVADGFLNSREGIRGVLVSTDKAADPISSYGISKLAAEHLWLWGNSFQKRVIYSVARYGNIFGSRGSVIETWTRLARQSLSLPITDPECTRFFMRAVDGSQFVLNVLDHGSRDRHIPEMKAAKMIELAEVIWKKWNPKAKFIWHLSGYRSIEKRHEVLKHQGESSADAKRFSKKELLELYQEWVNSWSES